MWCGLCAEEAAMGHADSCTTILNLIRLGNKKVKVSLGSSDKRNEDCDRATTISKTANLR